MIMINLNLYDDVVENINRQKTWINVKNKVLISREIKYRQYYFIGKRYSGNENFYFVIVLSNPPENKSYKKTVLDDYGRVKISLKSIWNSTSLKNLTDDCNISIEVHQEDDDGTAYYLDI